MASAASSPRLLPAWQGRNTRARHQYQYLDERSSTLKLSLQPFDSLAKPLHLSRNLGAFWIGFLHLAR